MGGDEVSGQDMHRALMDAMGRARECQEQMVPLSAKAAEAEKAYRVAKRQRMLWERAENRTAVTILHDIVGGYEDIASLRVERDCAEALRDANREALLLAKKEVDVLREVIAREWSAQ